MSRIERFLAKPKEFTIAGEKVTFTPLTVDDLPLMTKLGSKNPDVVAQATRDLLITYIKQIDPNAKEEQLSKFSLEFMEEMMGAIGEINNFDIQEARTKLLEDVKKRDLK